MKQPILSLNNITKIYPNGVKANDGISFHLNAGEIHAIAGENGAGKTTLMKILYGLEKPDAGEIKILGKRVKMSSPKQAIDHGLGMVHQHFMLIESLTVFENVILGSEYLKHGLLDREKAVQTTLDLAQKYDLHIDPYAKVSALSVGVKQRLEILKVLAKNVKIIILDEPTAVLTPQETKELFSQFKKLCQAGHAIIMITHKLNEIKAICDRVTIIRNGKNVGTFNVDSVSKKDISKRMIGKSIGQVRKSLNKEKNDIILEAKDVSSTLMNRVNLHQISFKLRRSEVLGVVGVEGNGQSILVDILTGEQKQYTGTVDILGNRINKLSIKQIRDLQVAHIPEDRMTKGVNRYGTIEDNMLSTRINHSAFNQFKGLIRRKKKGQLIAKSLADQYAIKTSGVRENINLLSGGNIQKVVCARELSTHPQVIIADQPSRGVDVGSMAFIHNQILDRARKGAAVALFSADLNEIFNLSDKIIVLYEGRLVAAFINDGTVNEEILGEYMLGIKQQDETTMGWFIHE